MTFYDVCDGGHQRIAMQRPFQVDVGFEVVRGGSRVEAVGQNHRDLSR